MLSKKEIEYIEQIENAIENNEDFYWQEDMYELIEMIKKQHGREQKLIEKLEEESNIHNENWKGIEIEKYAKEILSILKGENHE